MLKVTEGLNSEGRKYKCLFVKYNRYLFKIIMHINYKNPHTFNKNIIVMAYSFYRCYNCYLLIIVLSFNVQIT